MESVLLSIKEEIADETKYGSSTLHHNIGVLAEDSSKVMRCGVDQFSDSSFYCKFCHFTIFFQISEVSCQLKEEADEAKHYVPGNFPFIKEELLSER
jgi:hypothetical protein